MTGAEIREVIEAMIRTCGALIERNKAGEIRYPFVSARNLIIEVGRDPDEVLPCIAQAGFDYCLDSAIPCSTGVGGDAGRKERPSQDVCYWGADQMKSRLDAIIWRFSKDDHTEARRAQ